MADESVKQPAGKPVVDAKDYRRFMADTFGLRLSNNAAHITFSLEAADANEREFVSREATVMLTLPALKVLQIVLSSGIELVEKQFGPISLPPGKEEELRKFAQAFTRTK